MMHYHNRMPYETCDGCAKPILPLHDGNTLLGPYRFTRKGDKRVYCSRECRDGFKWEPGTCRRCGKSLEGRPKNTQFCSDACRKAASR